MRKPYKGYSPKTPSSKEGGKSASAFYASRGKPRRESAPKQEYSVKPSPVKEKEQKPQESWGGVANWYDTHLEDGDTYHTQVILPNLLRVLALKKSERVLDLACGQGFFARSFSDAGAKVTGADIAPELISIAVEETPTGIEYFVASADKLTFADDATYDTVVCVLAIQNIKDMRAVFAEANRVLKPDGRFVLVVNHPAFRIPKSTSWGWDPEAKVQYRRVDKYLSPSSVSIDMHPGTKNSEKTISFHRSLQDFFKTFSGTNFSVTKLEEWISHRTSEKGPRQKSEDIARREIPLFMLLEAKKI
jgi:ubiquinone/menaquinone biosynthesis C-methylase UbiE